MALSKERADAGAWLPVWVRHEHLERYAFAAAFAPDKVVLDCACGDGTGSAAFAAAGAREVRAFDVSADAVASASQKHIAPHLSFAVGDATKVPVPDQFADLYVSLETIEHIENDHAYLTEAVRVLKADGTFICSTPNRAVTNPGRSITTKPWNPFHVREYDANEFVELLSKYFGSIELYGQNQQFRAINSTKSWFARRLPGLAVVRFNQATKLPRLLFDRQRHHAVRPLEGNDVFEYIVAVCEQPRTKGE